MTTSCRDTCFVRTAEAESFRIAISKAVCLDVMIVVSSCVTFNTFVVVRALMENCVVVSVVLITNTVEPRAAPITSIRAATPTREIRFEPFNGSLGEERESSFYTLLPKFAAREWARCFGQLASSFLYQESIRQDRAQLSWRVRTAPPVVSLGVSPHTVGKRKKHLRQDTRS
jgi:hypothetical protein